MKQDVYRLGAALVVSFTFASMAGAHGGGGGGHAGGGHAGGGAGGFHGGGGGFSGGSGGFHGGGFHGGGGLAGGGIPGGGWHGGGGIAGGGWHGAGLPGGTHIGGIGGLSAGAGFGHVAGGNLSGIGHAPGFGGRSGIAASPIWHGGIGGNRPSWTGGFPGHGPGWAGGIPGAAASWSNAHPYSWYNGHWHNHWYGNGFGGYWGSNYPLGWGLAGWGLGSLWYSSGYAPYYNPYYAAMPGMAGAYNYAQPIPVAAPAPVAGGLNPAAGNLADAGNPDIDLAIEKFRAADYAGALALVDGVIRVQPSDAAAHELRGLILFAMEDYSLAAATVHSVLAVGPGWDWTTLSSLYSNIQIYTTQLEALENYVNLHPRQADARFLLAYHYMTAGHTDAAKEQLEGVVALLPSDDLAANLLRMVGGGAAPPPSVPPPPAPGPDVAPLDPAVLVGDWHANRDDGATFELNLAADKTFTWNFTQQNQNQSITGTYTLDKSILTLQAKNPGAMVAQVSTDGGNRFTFKPLGGPPDDPGLTFVR